MFRFAQYVHPGARLRCSFVPRKGQCSLSRSLFGLTGTDRLASRRGRRRSQCGPQPPGPASCSCFALPLRPQTQRDPRGTELNVSAGSSNKKNTTAKSPAQPHRTRASSRPTKRLMGSFKIHTYTFALTHTHKRMRVVCVCVVSRSSIGVEILNSKMQFG